MAGTCVYTIGHSTHPIDEFVGMLKGQCQALEADIRSWVKGWNEDPKPFILTKTAEQILDSLKRLLQRTTDAGN